MINTYLVIMRYIHISGTGERVIPMFSGTTGLIMASLVLASIVRRIQNGNLKVNTSARTGNLQNRWLYLRQINRDQKVEICLSSRIVMLPERPI